MKTHSTIAGNHYTVTSPNGGTVTDAAGKLNKVVDAGDQLTVMAPSEALYCSDDDADIRKANFKNARLALRMLGAGDNLLPSGYTRLEYLETTGLQTIKMNGLFDKHTGLRLDAETFEGTGNVSCVYFLTQNPSAETYWWVFPPRANRDNHSMWEWYWFKTFGSFKGLQLATRYVATINYRSEKKVTIEQNGTVAAKELPEPIEYASSVLNVIGSGWKGRCYSVHVSRNTELENNFVPALDETGAPCMFDTESRTPFYNAGTGDFVTQPTGASTYSLRGRRVLPDWGKLTENGLRRLYHAPARYKGDAYDYAMENGYKPIVETEQPEEGYWVPQWHDREDCIELVWVETEPPVEELSTIEA